MRKFERMYVYSNKKLIVVETNLAWALPYWKQRKAENKRITWRLHEERHH